jgi:hypothetical protein
VPHERPGASRCGAGSCIPSSRSCVAGSGMPT